jgi:inner membrane transporter RhtA
MTTSTEPAAATVRTDGPSPPGVARGLAMMLASGLSNQTGAGIGALAFPAIGPAGVVAVRQLIAAAVLLPTVRPRLGSFTRAQWWPVLLLATVFATMNLSLYLAIERIGLGLAVTLEFLGPLAVALVGTRRALDLLCALGAGIGVYVLVLPDGTTDVLGVGLALLAAGCWAAYILLNRLIGLRLPGLQGTAAASGVSALFYLPVLVTLVATGRTSAGPLAYAVTAGLLSSVVPFALDLTALRSVPARFFGVFMSINPVLAALAGLVVLGQRLSLNELLGIGIVVTANVVAVGTIGAPQPGPVRAHQPPPTPAEPSGPSVSSPAGPY